MSNVPKKSVLPPPVAVVVGRASAWYRALTKPMRILLVSTAVLTAAIVSLFGYRQTHEPYAVLFNQLEQDDAGAIAAKLKELNAPYKVSPGGTIEVPESRVGELRLELASAGMPRGGGVGFESFDKMKLGATEFEQRVLYRRALEGELSRTIGTLAAVQSARVHLVLPEKSVFVARAEPASASIVVRLRPGRALGASEVSGIVHLTAASVAGLSADRVALLTTDGEMLRKPRDSADGDTQVSDEERGTRQHAIEAELEERARQMLEKVVGPGHVDVRVTAELDPARVERVEEHYDPGKAVLRSEESSIERTGGNGVDDSVAGVPGAESNLPNGSSPPAALIPPTISANAANAAKGDAGAPTLKALAATAKAAEQPLRESHTRNYEVDHVSEKRLMEPGTLKRVAVAVVIDGVPHTENGVTTVVPRDHAELQKLEALVRSAVGATDARGDVVTLDSVPFNEEKAAADAPLAADPVGIVATINTYRKYLPAAMGAVVLLAIVLVVGLARRRPRAVPEVAAVLPAAPSAPPQLGTAKSGLDVRAAAIARASADPATAALVLRAWLGTTSPEGEAKPMVARN